MAGLKYWVWLSEVKGLTNRSKLLLLDHFGSPENIFYADEDEYRLVEGIEPRQIALLAEKSMEDADRILGACSRLGLRLLTMQDADYPVRLRNIFEPPCLLYVKGQLPVIDEEVAVAMVGTRKASPYGVEAAEKIAYGLSRQGAVVISGAAAGVDSASHRGALRAGGKTIAVLGNGLDVVYPAENEWLYRDIAASGALISEYPPGTAAEAWHFPVRNRIISGLSLATVVVEAPEKSGALITARHALEQGRDVFTLPGNLGNPTCAGNIQLLKQGAILVEEGWDILQEYTYLYPELPQRQRPAGPMTLTAQEAAGSVVVAETAAAPEKTDTKAVDKQENRAYIDVQEILPQVSPDEAAVLRLLEDGKQPVDRLIDETQLPAGRILSALTLLEVKGYVKRLPARYYELAKK